MRVAIVHYWFVSRRGGERVVEALCELFPQADLFALVVDRKVLSPALQGHKLTTSFLQRMPGSRKWHRHLLPLYPLAVEQFDLQGYDLVISTESGPAKGVLTAPDTCHVCFPPIVLSDPRRHTLGDRRKIIHAGRARLIPQPRIVCR